MKTAGIIFIVFALIVGIVPQLTDCLSQGRSLKLANETTVPMKCHWTAEAELAAAVPLLAVGLMTTFNKRKENLRNLGIMGAVLGAAVIALPTLLIGVCGSNMMICNMIMRPTLVLTGILTVVNSLWILMVAVREPAKRLVPGAAA